MSDTTTPPTAEPQDSPKPPGTGPAPSRRPQGTIDTTEAARLAGTALGMGRAGLRSAWQKGKEAAAARGVTEETVRQTVERGRAVAAERIAEQARRRGGDRAEAPPWPGSLPGSWDEPPTANPSPRGRGQPAAGGDSASTSTATATATRGTASPSAARAATRAGLGRLPSLAGRRLFGVFPTAASGSAPIERRLGAFALDLAVFALAFVLVLVTGEVLLGAAFGAGGDDWLGLAFDDVLRVVTLGEIGRAASGSASGVTFAWQVVYLLGFAAYMIGLEARSGATIGKRVLGLRVVLRAGDGGPVGYQRAAIRNACRVYDLLIPLWPVAVLDAIVTLLSPRRQRSGDWFAGTVVVNESDRP